MFDIKTNILIVCALIGIVIFIFKRKSKQSEVEVPAFLEKPWPLKTEWFSGEKHYPHVAGQFKVRRKYKATKYGGYMYDNCIWNGKDWLASDGRKSAFQDWEFQGLTEKVTP